MLSLIMQRCLDRSVQCYFSTHYSMLQLNPSNQRWLYCLLDKQISVYSKRKLFSTAAISLFTESDTKMKCFSSADWKEQSQYFPWGSQESSAPGGCFIMVLQTDSKAHMSVCVCVPVCPHTRVRFCSYPSNTLAKQNEYLGNNSSTLFENFSVNIQRHSKLKNPPVVISSLP